MNKNKVFDIIAETFSAPLSGSNFSYTEPHTLRLREKGNYAGMDFSGKDLSGFELSGSNFKNANFSGANLSGANLTKADLSGVNLTGTNISGAKFEGANFDPKVIESASFQVPPSGVAPEFLKSKAAE